MKVTLFIKTITNIEFNRLCLWWKKIYDGKVSGKRGRGKPRLTFEKTVSMILEKGYVKSMRMYEEVDDSGLGERGM